VVTLRTSRWRGWVLPLLAGVCLFLGVGHGHAVGGHVSLVEEPSLIAGTALVLCGLLLRLLRGPRPASFPRRQLSLNPLVVHLRAVPAPAADGARASPVWLQRFLA
jgi:hypothetical protein